MLGRIASALVLILGLSATAAGQKVSMQFDQAADFSAFHTFFVNPGLRRQESCAQQRSGQKTDSG